MRPSYQLTAHPSGSLREVWAVSWPLMLSLSSTSLMTFADRLFLAHYDLSAMNAVTCASAFCFVLLAFPLTICEITGVFVGRCHGKDDNEKIGKPVWQMFWLAMLSWPLFMIVSRTVAPMLFEPGSAEATYFVTSLDFGPLQLASYALMGFFLGVGKTKTITFSTLLTNVLNAILAPIMIFGTPFSPSMGVKGAAIATGLALLFQACFLLALLLRKENRLRYNTKPCGLQPKLVKEMLFLGVPAGIGRTAESIAHSLFFRIIAMAGAIELTSATIAQSCYMLVVFCVYGLSKAMTAIVSNLVGANALSHIPKAVFSAFKIHTILFLLLLAITYAGSELVLAKALNANDSYLLEMPEFVSTVRTTLFFMSVFFLLKGFSWIMVGQLTALGDTKFIMYINGLTHWVGYILPVYILVNYFEAGAITGWTVIAINSCIVASIFWYRSTVLSQNLQLQPVRVKND
ncbi:MAG: MATE family efflux transporter [Verrucomicrobia bacterium]|nr:MATE family efflux transporter [Verrucomicrobiota bacterium]